MDTSALSRGLRNHNPLNIRYTGEKWQGSAEQRDSAFHCFVNNAYGYRAAFKTIRSHMLRGETCIDKLIKGWAPASDGNNTESYIRQVSKMTGVGRYVILYTNDVETMVSLVHAMAIVENGMKYLEFIKEEEIRQGYHLAFG